MLDAWPDFTALLFSSDDRRSAMASLISDWEMSEVQASYAADPSVGRATKEARLALAQELSELRAALKNQEE